MNNRTFISYGIVFMLFTMISESFWLSPGALLLLYIIMAIIAVVLLIKYKTTEPLILSVSSVFIVAYTIIDLNISKEEFYTPNGIHFMIGLVLVIFGIVNIVKANT